MSVTYCVTNPKYLAQLCKDLPANAGIDSPQFQIHVKADQSADVWIFNDPVQVLAYLNGLITEEELYRLHALQRLRA